MNLGTWSEVVLAGHPCDTFEPPVRNPHGYAVLYLHGVHLTRLAGNRAFSAAFAKHGLPVVAPLTQRSWWTDRICDEFDPKISAWQHVTDKVLPFLEQSCGTRPPGIGLLGTGMGGQGALRFSYKLPNVFPVVAALSPAIDYHLRFKEGDETLPRMYRDREQARQDTAILHVHPLNWPRHEFFCCDPADERWFDSADRLRMKLAAIGIPFECDLQTSGGGHSFEYYNRMADRAMDFIADKLERERLRVV